MLSFVLSKAGALTAAAVLGLGGLGAYALTSVPDSPSAAAGKPKVRTEVVHRTRHVQGPPLASPSQASTRSSGRGSKGSGGAASCTRYQPRIGP